MIFADIIVDISHEKLDRPFQYIIPESLEDKILIGSAVKIPFGKGNRIIPGYVIGITEIPSWEVDKMKEILSVEEKKITLESELIQIAWFIRETCGATMNQALKTVIPGTLSEKTCCCKNTVSRSTDETDRSESGICKKCTENLVLCSKRNGKG